jgi:ATP-dependent Lhr-like helicase
MSIVWRQHPAVSALFRRNGWRPLPFQKETWRLMAQGCSGLLHATTGAGKTLAVGLGAWQARRAWTEDDDAAGLTVLWITPMRALAADSFRSLAAALEFLNTAEKRGAPWTIGLRTGDTSGAQRVAQGKRPPNVLITTPESLCIMLSREDAASYFSELRCVVVDEWHELFGSKRGVQTQLALARLRHWRPGLMTWGMSATLGNVDAAMRALLGPRAAADGALVAAHLDKPLIVDTLLPDADERFPWAGHLGLKMASKVVAEIDSCASALLFVNTRAQAELWHQKLVALRPDWAERIGLHHGSLAQESRAAVECGLKEGRLRAVVCTSSLDLGVDFLPVERVLQIGSPKGVARLLQRAGRSGHAPGRPSRVTLVPSHSLELVESRAAQLAIGRGAIEAREGPEAPLDVLAQHLVTIALGGGFVAAELLDEVRDTVAYENLTEESWRWCLDFIRHGGPSLAAYPDYRRATPDAAGVWRVGDKRLASRHRMNIGAIVSDPGVMVQYGPAPRGPKLGAVEESFVARLKPGDSFWFAGKLLELVAVRDLTAFVRKGRGGGGTPRWAGGRMPLSTTLAQHMVEALGAAAQGRFDSPEMRAAKPMLELQAKWSALPAPGRLVVETLRSREGWHLFVYPFAGRSVHLGLASLLAWRAAQHASGTFSIAVNDYGFELLSGAPRDWAAEAPGLIAVPRSRDALAGEILESLNASEMARRRFRDIARIAGLVVTSVPGGRRGARALQASSSLFYDVFRRHDPDNGLLRQAERELLEDELDVRRLHAALDGMNACAFELRRLSRCSPLAFPLLVERLREKLTNETLAMRIERMLSQLNAAADA